MGNVIHLGSRAPHATPEKLADAWDGIVRMMEANGRATVEIGLDDARWVARLARKAVQ